MLRLLKMALCAIAITTSVLSANHDLATARVTLWLDLPANFARLVSTQLERELQTIVEPSGLQIEWLRLPAQAGVVVDGPSIVVRFRGSCTPSLENAGRRQAAGWAHVADGKILPFIEIDCDQVWSVIESDLVSASGFQREFYFGRGLARVLAHELHHVLSNTMEHSTQGLTKARLESRELIGGKYTLSLADLRPSVRTADAPAAVVSVPVSHARPAAASSGHSASPSSFAAGESSR